MSAVPPPGGFSAGGASAASSVLGDALSFIGQRQTNEQAQEDASNAMTLRVADLRRAGLNPLLAVNSQGAMVPSLTNPMSAFGNLGGQTAQAISSGSQAAMVDSQVKLNTSLAGKADAEAQQTALMTKGAPGLQAAQTRAAGAPRTFQRHK